MIQSSVVIDIPLTNPQPSKVNLPTFFTHVCLMLFQFVANLPTFFTHVCLMLFQFVGNILALVAISIRDGLVAPTRQLWTNYYPQVAFGEEGGVTPYSSLSFIINALLALTEIKSQNQPGFPFQTHPLPIMISVTSLLMYALSSAAELVISAAGLDRASVYAIIVHLGNISSLCILVASLASLFYI